MKKKMRKRKTGRKRSIEKIRRKRMKKWEKKE